MSKNVDISEALAAFKKGGLTVDDLLDIEKPIALTIVNKQREKVPVDTAATKNSISPHLQKASGDEVVDHIGPETNYAPYIELGVASKPNYPIQPFVRPSVFGNERALAKVAGEAMKRKVTEKYGRA